MLTGQILCTEQFVHILLRPPQYLRPSATPGTYVDVDVDVDIDIDVNIDAVVDVVIDVGVAVCYAGNLQGVRSNKLWLFSDSHRQIAI